MYGSRLSRTGNGFNNMVSRGQRIQKNIRRTPRVNLVPFTSTKNARRTVKLRDKEETKEVKEIKEEEEEPISSVSSIPSKTQPKPIENTKLPLSMLKAFVQHVQQTKREVEASEAEEMEVVNALGKPVYTWFHPYKMFEVVKSIKMNVERGHEDLVTEWTLQHWTLPNLHYVWAPTVQPNYSSIDIVSEQPAAIQIGGGIPKEWREYWTTEMPSSITDIPDDLQILFGRLMGIAPHYITHVSSTPLDPIEHGLVKCLEISLKEDKSMCYTFRNADGSLNGSETQYYDESLFIYASAITYAFREGFLNYAMI